MKRTSTTRADLRVAGGRLITLSGTLLGRTYLVRPALVIGRNSAQVRLLENEVSRLHARVWREPDGSFHVEDLGSRNGTFVNGAQITRSPLLFGDRLRVGRTTFVFSLHDEECEAIFERNRVDTVGHVTLGLVHDFNNALCVVKSMTALLRDDPTLSKESRDECLADMADACERAEQLTKRMMGFARGHHTAAPIHLRDVVLEALRLVRRALPDSVELLVDVPAGLLLYGDSTQLMQVLLNLVINARDAIDAHHAGRIWIGAAPRGEEILLSVRDDGCGMTADVRSRLFEPFFTTKGAKGNGIGLVSVQEIVHNHGGRIEVDSTVGVGTTIVVRLPAEAESPASTRARASMRDGGLVAAGAGERILVLDPSPGSRRSIEKLLLFSGFSVQTAGALQEAEALAQPLDALVVDLDLDERGELGRLIATQRHRANHLAIICLVSTPHDAVLARARALGAHVVLPKPFDRTELLTAVHRALWTASARDVDETQQIPRG